MLEQLSAVKKGPVLDRLDEELAKGLVSPEDFRLGIGWPHERTDDSMSPSSYSVSGAGRDCNGQFSGEPTLDHLLQIVGDAAEIAVLARARTVKLQLFRDADAAESMSQAIPLRDWLTAKVDLDGTRYALHGGRWFRMNHDYANRLRSHVEEIFARQHDYVLPDWNLSATKNPRSGKNDEGEYNKFVAASMGGFLLDKDLIYTVAHPHGIEAYDVLLPDHEFPCSHRLIHRGQFVG